MLQCTRTSGTVLYQLNDGFFVVRCISDFDAGITGALFGINTIFASFFGLITVKYN